MFGSSDFQSLDIFCKCETEYTSKFRYPAGFSPVPIYLSIGVSAYWVWSNASGTFSPVRKVIMTFHTIQGQKYRLETQRLDSMCPEGRR